MHGQLLWREFFYCAATKNPNFDRMQGNPICVQIPWDKNVEALAKWANVSEFEIFLCFVNNRNREFERILKYIYIYARIHIIHIKNLC